MIAVNLLMASFAVSGFHGVVVENSYVASQNFKPMARQGRKIPRAGMADRNGSRRADGRVVLQTEGVPTGAAVTAELRRPNRGQKDFAQPYLLRRQAKNTWLSNETVAEGRWTMRMAIAAAGQDWAGESENPVNAPAPLPASASDRPLVSTRFTVPGMRCAGCIAKIERELPRVDGIIAARANFLGQAGGDPA